MNNKRSFKNKRILITCGPTWSPIDQVRVISNCSTGELGLRLANALSHAGFNVTVLRGPVLFAGPSKNLKIIPFQYYDELHRLLRREAKKNYAIIIHAAAVSDFKVKTPSETKLTSQGSAIKLTLEPTEKIIEKIKKINPEVFLVGFKLETTMRKKDLITKAHALLKKAQCDLVVANHFSKGVYRGYIVDPLGHVLSAATSRQNLVKSLVRELINLTTDPKGIS